jgi:sugar/nucleoside kinase (ribokinase family)
MAAEVLDIAVVGHFSIDHLKLPGKTKFRTLLGGAVAYVSLAARQLDASVSIISKVGADFPEIYLRRLRKEGVDLSAVKAQGQYTTSFELTYDEDFSGRTLRLRNKGSPIKLDDIPSSLQVKAVHIAPIAVEIQYDAIAQLRSRCQCLSIDPQGLTRRFDENGNVSCCAQLDKRILNLVDVYKSSLEEILVSTGQSDLEKAIRVMHALGPATVIVTMGERGSVLSVQNIVHKVPACKPKRTVDPTGAGDVFISAFLSEYVHQKDALWCAFVGSAAASLVVEGVGTTFFGEKEEIYRRAVAAYEKEIKQ